MSLQLNIESGDIVLFSRKCSRMLPLPAAICVSAKVSSWTVWDHVGIVVEHPETKELLFLEANIQGITAYPLIDRIKRTSANQIAVRKLHRIDDDNVNFQSLLWNTIQKYLAFQYNSSFSHMTAAAYASYTSHLSAYAKFHDKLFTLKQELQYINDFLNHEEESIPKQKQNFLADIEPQSPSFLSRFLSIRAEKLVEEIESAESTFQKLVHLRQAMNMKSKATSESSPALSQNEKLSKERFYCSQLVAQIFMDMGILSRVHRQAHEYVPADFSSSTMIQGLLPLNHGPDHDYHERHFSEQTTNDKDGKKPKYFFSPDYIISSPNTAIFLPVEKKRSDLNSGSNLTVIIPESKLSKYEKTSKKPNQSVASLSLHTGDTIRSSILSQYLEPQNTSSRLVRVEIEGEVLLRPMGAASVSQSGDTLVPPSVLLSGITTSRPSVAGKMKKKFAKFSSDKDVNSVASGTYTANVYVTQSESSKQDATAKDNEYDDDTVLSTMRAYEHHHSQQSNSDEKLSDDAFEVLALKASKIRFIYEENGTSTSSNSTSSNDTDYSESNSHEREHERKILRWKYIESLISLAWPTFHEANTSKEKTSATSLTSFANETESLYAMWQELIAYLPSFEVGTSAESIRVVADQKLAELRMFFAFICYWDDTIRHLQRQLDSISSHEKNENDGKWKSLVRNTADDLADMLMHLYVQHHKMSPVVTSHGAINSWKDSEHEDQEQLRRKEVITSRIEQILPRFLSSTNFPSNSSSSSESSSFGFGGLCLAGLTIPFFWTSSRVVKHTWYCSQRFHSYRPDAPVSRPTQGWTLNASLQFGMRGLKHRKIQYFLRKTFF
jgi:hypothetical protein